MQIELDEFDLKILEMVQLDLRLPMQTLAEKVCLSPSAVQRRLNRLRQSGVIEAERAILSPEAVGQKIMAIVAITLADEQPDVIKEFKQTMVNALEVMQCYYVTGSADFIVILTTRTIQDFDTFARRFFLEKPYIKRYQTNIVLQRVKSSLAVSLESKN